MIVKDEQAVKIVVVLDESGSMSHLRSDVIGGFNTLIQDQKKLPGKADVTLYTFSNKVVVRLDGVDLENVSELDDASYQPGGMTAMNDAIGTALAALLRENVAKAIISIFTDGHENASVEYNSAQVKDLVKQCEDKGYQVVFLAANIDEVAVAKSFGLAASATRGFEASQAGIMGAHTHASASITSYRTGGFQ